MYTRSLVTIVLLMLCAFTTVLASPPPPPSKNFTVTSPKYNKVYHVGDEIPVRISVSDLKGDLYLSNPVFNVWIQKDIRFPDLNEKVGQLRLQTLYKEGYKFKAKKEYLIKQQANVPFRVRVNYETMERAGYSDSPAFQIKK
ncbi:hypothetical protein BGZ49_010804 [Haplosporangium sp. Z 27]|nr:hypothetical protein BGZ49_010804 [Haplosporangium sp. Z 27]